ncbi:MAG: hypothetical protein AAF628_36665 [Planctomycetota bacterium]
MGERRSLAQGLAEAAPAQRKQQEREFVYADKPNAQASRGPTPLPPPITRSPLTSRVRDDYVKALKRISLERQLQGIGPNSLQDMLEQAIEAWLRDNGELK